MEDAMREILEMFFAECEEHLDAIQEGFEALGARRDDPEIVNDIFRAVHSIKGGAAAFNLVGLVDFAHAFENTLDHFRAGDVAMSDALLAILVGSADILHKLVAASQGGGEADAALVRAQIEMLKSACDPSPDLGAAARVADHLEPYSISFRPFPDLFECGGEPARLLRDLAALGETEIVCDARAVPGLDDFDPLNAYLSWTAAIRTSFPRQAILDVFEFAEGLCHLSVEPSTPNPPGERRLEEPSTPAAAPKIQVSAPEEQVEALSQTSARSASVRVELDRVDRLINLVGELVINQAMLSQSVLESGLVKTAAISAGLDEFKQLTREVQESVLAIRAQPIKPLFQRMARNVREAAAATGKTVNFVSEGEATELDKTVLERLSDPLTHMIRNAIDHGLEHGEERLARGKPAAGLVRLSAEHRSGRVLIEVSDDGRGIDRARVREAAAEKGLIPRDAVLSNAEIDNLLFLPGFSTARKVSDLSGRGVGMDVVKQSISALRGRISIASHPGKGTSFSISLPLTLAILDGMIVRVGAATIVVPLSAIVELLKPGPGQIHPIGVGQYVIHVRGAFIPVIDVAHRLGFGERLASYDDRVIIVIEADDGEQRALVVDEIHDQRQVVIKGLEDNCGRIPGVAAATILGDGRVALILDTDAVISGAGVAFPPLAIAG